MANGKLPPQPIDLNILIDVLQRQGIPVSRDAWTDLSIDQEAVQEALDRGWDFQIVDGAGNPVEAELEEVTADSIVSAYGGGWGKDRNKLRVYAPEGQGIAIGPANDVLVFQEGQNIQTRFVEGDYIADKRPILEAFEEAKTRGQMETTLNAAANPVIERAEEIGGTVEGSLAEGKLKITIPDGANGEEIITISLTEDGGVQFDVTNYHDWDGGDDEGHDDSSDPEAQKRKAAKKKMTDKLRKIGLKLKDSASGTDPLQQNARLSRRPPMDSPLGDTGGHSHSHDGHSHSHDTPSTNQAPPVQPPQDQTIQRFSKAAAQVPEWMKKGL
jgi:hypothetical protein